VGEQHVRQARNLHGKPTHHLPPYEWTRDARTHAEVYPALPGEQDECRHAAEAGGCSRSNSERTQSCVKLPDAYTLEVVIPHCARRWETAERALNASAEGGRAHIQRLTLD